MNRIFVNKATEFDLPFRLVNVHNGMFTLGICYDIYELFFPASLCVDKNAFYSDIEKEGWR